MIVGIQGLAPQLIRVVEQLGTTVTDEMKKAAEESSKMFNNLFNAGGVFGGFAGALAGRLKSQQLDPLTAQLKEYDDLIKLLNDRIKTLADDNNRGGDTLRNSQEIMRLDAERTRLLQQQTNARKEYERIEASITAHEKQQHDLSFLQQQVKLLDMINQYGLNPQDILGGMQLGLDTPIAVMY